jgi:hypothetical protein
MIYVIVDLNGSTHSRFDDPADLLAELDETRAVAPDLIDDLAVLKYNDAGERSGPPVPAASLIPREAQKVGAVLVSSYAEGVGLAYHTRDDAWRLQPGARVPESPRTAA